MDPLALSKLKKVLVNPWQVDGAAAFGRGFWPWPQALPQAAAQGLRPQLEATASRRGRDRGHYWPLLATYLATIGQYCATVDYYWPVFGHYWPLLDHYTLGHYWPLLVVI